MNDFRVTQPDYEVNMSGASLGRLEVDIGDFSARLETDSISESRPERPYDPK